MPEKIIRVNAGVHERRNCPVSVEFGELPNTQTRLEDSRGKPIPHHIENCKLHFILSSLKAGESIELRLVESAGRTGGVSLKNNPSEKIVDVRVRGKLFTRYHYSDEYARPFLYPIIGPYGLRTTRSYPMEEVEGETRDHPHHRSCWVAWGDVDGTDHWSETDGHGRIVHQKFLQLSSNPCFGVIKTLNHWLTNSGEKQLEEERTYIFYNTSEPLFDLEVRFRMSEHDIRFGDTKEGGIVSFRVATPMDVTQQGVMRSSFGGVNEAECWGKRAFWCDYSGTLEGKTVGIAVFDTPGNFRYPTYWHVRNYGLMTANPFGLSHFLGEGHDGSLYCPVHSELVFRYRVFIHRSDALKANVAQRFIDYIYPPEVEVE